MKENIKRLDDFGRGITYINDKITFVSGALDTEDVEINVVEEKKNYNVAETVKVLKQSYERVDNDCKYFPICGGCNLRHFSKDKELEFKSNKVKNILNKFGKVDINTVPIYSDDFYNYRNKVVLRVVDNKLGLLEENSNNLVEIDECKLLNNKLNEILIKLKDLIKNEDINKIMLRISNDDKEVMLSIDGNVKNIDKFKEISDSLIINGKPITKDYITSNILDYKFHVRANSFFQVNGKVTEELYNEVIRHIKNINAKNVLDLYCGVGTIGISISKYVDKVVGVEIVKEAIDDALENKNINKVNNIEFINSSVDKVIDKFNNFDTIIVDPPRKGLDSKTKKYLQEINPNYIIYVSCDPVTLSRDIKDLSDNYKVKDVKVFNMFPRTYHCESITVLERK